MSYDLLEVPDGITPLLGIRGWRYQDGLLWSCYRDVSWPVAGPLSSECIQPVNFKLTDDEQEYLGTKKSPKHGTPIKTCSCGIYALNEYPHPNVHRTKPWPSNSIIGVILGWGHIIMGTKGFRAQYAKPIALIQRPRATKYSNLLDELSNIYGVEQIESKELTNEYWRRSAEGNHY